jgi:DNA-binding NarL/FixJ family response regulator
MVKSGIRTKQSIFIVDDHPIVREGLAMLINQERDLQVCGDAGDAQQALSKIAKNRPDAVIVDITLGRNSGLRLIEDLSQSYPDIPVLTLSMHDESIYAERCLMAGAKGYIMKQEPPEKMIAALRKVLGGDIYISENISAKLLQKMVSGKSAATLSPIELLSNRELEVFQLIGQGVKTRKIAEQLNLSIKTIETYIDHIKKKMNFEDSRRLLLYAVQWAMKDTVE